MAEELRLLAVVGNPKVASRTLDVAMEVSRQIKAWLEHEGQATDVGAIDIAELSVGLLDWESAPVNQALERVQSADLLIVASPVYKATFTGLLKIFLDRVPMEGLGGLPAVPNMCGI